MAQKIRGGLSKLSPGHRKILQTPGMSALVAKKLKISRQAVSDWDKVPISRLAQVSKITGIPREELRPDIYE